MKEVSLIPACVMSVPCPFCQAKGRAKFEQPPSKDFLTICPKCKEKFKVKLNIRKSYRKELAIVTSYSFSNIKKIDEKGSIPGEIVDLSKGGMAVESSKMWLSRLKGKEKRPLTFIFLLPPKHDIVKVKGVITRISEEEEKGKFRIGIRFVDIEDDTARKIGRFLWN